MNILSPIFSLFEDPIGLARPLWRDYSRWQGRVNFDVASINGVCGMAARAAISWGYQDAWFPHNWYEADQYGLYRTSFHVPYFDQPVIRQMDNWYKVHPTLDIVPRVSDMEVKRDQSPNAIANSMWKMSNIVLERDGMRPIIYSRYRLINEWLASWSPEMLNEHYWWLAQYRWDRYREHPGPPTLPNRIKKERIILHQTADKKAGFPGEVESRSVDYDRWELGNEENMHEWIMHHWGDGSAEDFTITNTDWATGRSEPVILVDNRIVQVREGQTVGNLNDGKSNHKKVKVELEAWIHNDHLE